jgi:hypothetical protein
MIENDVAITFVKHRLNIRWTHYLGANNGGLFIA